MSVFSSPSFDQHELVTFSEDVESGLRAIIAVHNSNLGPATGGCRMFPYVSDQQALEDVLRLSRGMTYKTALAGLPMGGGKAVIIGDPQQDKSPALLEAMGRFIDSLGGRYVTAEDSGTGVEDMEIIQRQTQFVSGLNADQAFGGDPSPFTAQGVLAGIKAALAHKFGSHDLADKRVAVQGAGSVGRHLIELLVAADAQVIVSDVNEANLQLAVAAGATRVEPDQIISADVDVFSPCAMGAILNVKTIPLLRAPIVAGAANNQLACLADGEMLRQRGKLYAPDFVVNAGGIIEIHHQNMGTLEQSQQQVEGIGDTLDTIFALSARQSASTTLVAEQIARTRFLGMNSSQLESKQVA